MISQDLKTRILAALVLIAVIVPVLLWGGIIGVAALTGIVVAVGLRELRAGFTELNKEPAKTLTIFIGLAVVAGFYILPESRLTAILALTPLIIIIIHVGLYNKIQNTHLSSAQMILAITYVAVPLSHAILMRKLEAGIPWIFYMLVVVALGDAFAYFFGKRFGKRKLVPNISPQKTYEGFGGVFVGGLIGMIIVKSGSDLLGQPLPSYGVLIPLTILLGFAGPLGDLMASAFKRRMGLEDFGSIIPGHGGALDRADSHILAFPGAYYFLTIFFM